MPALYGAKLLIAAGRAMSAARVLLLSIGLRPGFAAATPITLSSDDPVIERLPPGIRPGTRPGIRTRTRIRTRIRIRTRADPATAAAEARKPLTASRREADPRFAGRALARPAPWQPASEAARAPAEGPLVQAEAKQLLHNFDGATRRLQALTQSEPGNAQADQRPEHSGHPRERALGALDLLDPPTKALVHARKNPMRQPEPIDLWLLARCARAAGDTGAPGQARQAAAAQGLQDARLDAL